MKLTKAQVKGLKNIAEWTKKRPSFHKETASNTMMAVRLDTLEGLEKASMIHSQGPFAGSYHTVTLTESGRRALEEMNK